MCQTVTVPVTLVNGKTSASPDPAVVAAIRRPDLRSEVPKMSGLVEAEEVKDERPSRREEDQEQYILYGDARRKEAVHAAWKVRKVHAYQHSHDRRPPRQGCQDMRSGPRHVPASGRLRLVGAPRRTRGAEWGMPAETEIGERLSSIDRLWVFQFQVRLRATRRAETALIVHSTMKTVGLGRPNVCGHKLTTNQSLVDPKSSLTLKAL